MTGDIVGLICDNLMKLLPWRVVGEDQQGVRWTLGVAGNPRGHGWVWFMPLFQKVDIVDVTYAALSLGYQTFGDMTVCVEVSYRVDNAQWFLVFVSDGDHEGVIKTQGRSVVAAEYGRKSGGNLALRVLRKLKVALSPWGIKIFRCAVTERINTQNLRLLGNSSKEPE